MKKVYKVLVGILLFLVIILAYFSITRPIKIALVGNFNSDRESFVTSTTIAAKIAEQDIADTYEVSGRKLDIIIYNTDFLHTDELCKKLIKNDIEVMITTASSQNLEKLKPYLEKYNIFCMSVSSTAVSLSEKKDSIYRIFPDDTYEVLCLLDFIESENLKKEFAIIYDENNMVYENSIKNEIIKNGGKILLEESWNENVLSYEPLNTADMNEAGAVIILGSSKEAGFLLQKLKAFGVHSLICGFSWSGDYNVIDYGGRASEDFAFVTPIKFSSQDKEYLEFKEKSKAYNKLDGSLVVGVYEAFMIIRELYEIKQKEHITIEQVFKIKNKFKVLARDIEFDEYGDCKGKEYIIKVKKGQFANWGKNK
jgi:ABC-type branched-subunit amino acid transport system substrate-binding protein